MSSKNSNFIQLYRENVDIFRVISTNPTAIEILALVIKHMDTKNNVVTTIKQLCKLTGKSKPSVYAAIKILKDKRVIHVTNTGGTCLFMCNANFAWTSYAGSRQKYAKTQAVMLVDETEFPDYELKISNQRGVLYDSGTGEM